MAKIEIDQSSLAIESDILRGKAVAFTVAHDDGVATSGYEKADVILVGLPRTGKTLVSVYLALNNGIFAANYPLIIEDLQASRFPQSLAMFKEKLVGITIKSDYWYRVLIESGRESRDRFSVQECMTQISIADNILRENVSNIIEVTGRPVEDVAKKIVELTGLKKHIARSDC